MTAAKPTILIIGTLDTKLAEILYLRTQISASQTEPYNPGIPADELLLPLLEIAEELARLERGDCINRAIRECVPIVRQMVANSVIQGMVSAAGSCGSSMATALMRSACPIGFPKLMVSNMASGEIKPYIEETDIVMMYSVVDIAGLNSVLRQILSDAAGAIVGMTSAYVLQRNHDDGRRKLKGKRIAVSMFGVTAPCVEMIRNMLTSTPHDVSCHELFVFHATGSGGLAMERLIEEGQIDAVIDLTKTEIADEVVGGVLTSGPKRLEAATRRGIPTIVSVGACDIVNFGPLNTVPRQFDGRRLYVHNPAVTLMRTTPEENRSIGALIATKLRGASDPSAIQVILPSGGLSMMDAEGQPFHDPEADLALFESIRAGLSGSQIEIQDHPSNINSEEFAREVCENLLGLMGISPRNYRLAKARRRQWSSSHGHSIDAIRKASLVNIPGLE